jgi:protein associated with RNAse G/E
MSKKQTLSNPYQVRLTLRCEKAWLYLQKHNVNVCQLLREGGEKSIIDRAKEFYIDDKNNCPF